MSLLRVFGVLLELNMYQSLDGYIEVTYCICHKILSISKLKCLFFPPRPMNPILSSGGLS